MATALESGLTQSFGLSEKVLSKPVTTSIDEESQYWWETTGLDLAKMLREANYPEEALHRFLAFYRENVCPRLGSRPKSDSAKSGIGKDGDPFEYSFEFKGSTKSPGVRFGMDLSPLRPADAANPLSIENSQKVVDALRLRTPDFDDSWYQSMCHFLVKSHLPREAQDILVKQAGHQMPMVIGFDLHKDLSSPHTLPILGKVYFPPCFAAAEQDITRWDAVRKAIWQLPRIVDFPNILRSLKWIEDYLRTKSKDFENGVRYLATDFVAPEKSRLKIYMRYPGTSFEEIWDFYTLGGRITGLEEDKEKFRDLMNMMSDSGDVANAQSGPDADGSRLGKVRVKTTTIYFSLSAENPGPAPKIGFFPPNTAKNDQVIARGLDQWLSKYGWYDGGKTLEERLDSVL